MRKHVIIGLETVDLECFPQVRLGPVFALSCIIYIRVVLGTGNAMVHGVVKAIHLISTFTTNVRIVITIHEFLFWKAYNFFWVANVVVPSVQILNSCYCRMGPTRLACALVFNELKNFPLFNPVNCCAVLQTSIYIVIVPKVHTSFLNFSSIINPPGIWLTTFYKFSYSSMPVLETVHEFLFCEVTEHVDTQLKAGVLVLIDSF